MVTRINYTGNVWRGGKSSVNVVKYSVNQMDIWFRDISNNQAKYRYKKSVVGSSQYNRMKSLANNGKGLNTYLHKHRIKGERK